MAGSFGHAAGTLLAIDLGIIGLFVLGSGLSVPLPISLSPASVCFAQFAVYETVGTLQPCIVAVLATSSLLCAWVKVELHVVESLAQIGETKRRLLRAGLLLGVVTSAATVALGLATYLYVFQVKVAVFACVTAGARASLVGCYAVAIPVCTAIYLRLGWVAVTSSN